MATVSVGPTGNNTGYATAAINAWVQSNYEKMWGGISPVFALLAAKGKVQAGGLGYKIPVRYPATGGPATVSTTEYTGSTGDAFDANLLTFTRVVGLTEYEFKPAEYLIPFAVEQYQLDNLSNKTQVADYMEAVVQQALDRHMWDLLSDFWRNPVTGGSYYTYVGGQNRKAFGSILQYLNCGSAAGVRDGLEPLELTEQLAVGVHGTSGTAAISAYWPGGIARPVSGTDTAARWNTPMVNTSQVIGPTTLGPLYNLACNGNDMPDIIVVNRAIFDKIEASITTAGGSTPWGIQSPGVAAQLGIPSIRYKSADIVMDEKCPSVGEPSGGGDETDLANVVLCINSKYIGFRFSTGKPALNKDEPSIRPEIKEAANDGRPIKRWVGRVVGQMVASNLGRVHSRHNNFTTS